MNPAGISGTLSGYRRRRWRRRDAERSRSGPCQWKRSKGRVFESCGPTCANLPAGAYDCRCNPQGEVQIVSKRLHADDLIEFASSLPAEILTEIEKFWSLAQRFKNQGFLHRRGYLLHGPQGSGKSSVVHQVVRNIIRTGHVAFFCEVPEVFILALQQFRKVEPDRPMVCVFEDIDAIIEAHDETALLQCLDGSHQIDKVINIATTNYPEKLDRRLVSRPRRFDRIIRIEEPSSRMREAYFRQKLPDLKPGELARWIHLTEGLSFAGLVETVVSVTCLGNDLEETTRMLQDMETRSPRSREYRGRTIGFQSPPSFPEEEESED